MNIVVTGASRGIGYALVKSFVSSGSHRLGAIARTTARLNMLGKECAALNPKAEVLPFGMDLAQTESYEEARKFLDKNFGKIDVLVNNAGLLINKRLEDISIDEVEKMIEVNVTGLIRFTQVVLPMMKESRSAHIVNISSMGGFQGSVKFAGLSVYSACKAAVACFSECLAEELKDTAVKVNCLALGAVQTEMLSQAFPDYKAPLNPDEIAGFISSFALHGHRHFNGKILPVSVTTP